MWVHSVLLKPTQALRERAHVLRLHHCSLLNGGVRISQKGSEPDDAHDFWHVSCILVWASQEFIYRVPPKSCAFACCDLDTTQGTTDISHVFAEYVCWMCIGERISSSPFQQRRVMKLWRTTPTNYETARSTAESEYTTRQRGQCTRLKCDERC